MSAYLRKVPQLISIPTLSMLQATLRMWIIRISRPRMIGTIRRVPLCNTRTRVKLSITFSILGHSDGLRFNAYTHLLWTTSNEDGNSRIVTISPDTGVITPYVFPSAAPHGGGCDDVALVGDKACIAASNPTLNSRRVNTAPAVDEITLTNGRVVLPPILNGNGAATDLVTNQ